MKLSLLKGALAVAAGAFAAVNANAAVELPEIISDNAVLQQNTDARLWGWAKPGAKVTVTPSWDGKTYSAVADSKTGRWELTVATPKASYTPYSITFSDGTPTTIGNVLIGEVWFCSGQSNMEMPLNGFWTQPVKDSAREIAMSGKHPGVRMATLPKKVDYEVQDRVEGKWKTASPENAGEFSATAWFFGRELNDILDVPVGLLVCSYGGSKVEGWLPKWKLDEYPEPEWSVEADKTAKHEYDYDRINVMYNAMFNPVKRYTVRGIIWNQGESNVGKHDSYPAHLADMVQIWRDEMGVSEEVPFYQVEIPGWGGYDDNKPDGISAALLREAQHRSTEIIPNSGIVCTADLILPDEQNDIHGSRKREIGERLAWMAGKRTYGVNGLADQYPSFKEVKFENGKAIISFNNAPLGLTPNDAVDGFEIAGADGVFHPANAVEEGWTLTMEVSSPDVPDPKAVRYCFKNFTIGTLFGVNGLPVIPFRTDK